MNYYLFVINDEKGKIYNILYDGDPDNFIFDTIKNKHVIINKIEIDKQKWDNWLKESKENMIESKSKEVQKLSTRVKHK